MKHTVLVTGASRGIGRATALKFAREGHRVVLNYCSNEKAIKELVQICKDNDYEVMPYKADVSDPKQVAGMFASVKSTFGPVDVLVNNAGIAPTQKVITDYTIEEIDKVMGVNLNGSLLCAREAIPDMVSNKSGSIVFISSFFGIVGGSCEVPYSASKAAVIGLTKALAKELGPSNIRVNAVAPGMIMTDMNAHLSDEDVENIRLNTPIERVGYPEDVAESVYFLSMEETASFITGNVLCVDGGAAIS